MLCAREITGSGFGRSPRVRWSITKSSKAHGAGSRCGLLSDLTNAMLPAELVLKLAAGVPQVAANVLDQAAALELVRFGDERPGH